MGKAEKMMRIFTCLLALLFSMSSPAMEQNADFWRSSLAANTTVGKTIGLGLEDDLFNLRGSGAITYKNGGWQQAGLTTVNVGKATEPAWFRMSFNEASQNAGAIRFDVSSFNPTYPKPGMTSWELNQIVNNPSLLGKTTFIQNGQQVIWNGTGFVRP